MSEQRTRPKLPVAQFARTPQTRTQEDRFWQRFKTRLAVKQTGLVHGIEFSPVAPHTLAVAAGTRVLLVDPLTNRVRKTLTRFQDVVRCASYRADGRMLVTGDDAGLVQVLDPSNRSVLRQCRGHRGSVHAARITLERNIVSAGNDRVVRLWDMSTGECVHAFEGHEDYVRSLALSTSSPDIVISGSYDRTVRLWDLRTRNAVSTLRQPEPVEDVLPCGGLIFVAASNKVHVWDSFAQDRCLHVLSNHQKTISSLALDGARARLLTGSLDHHIKVYDVASFDVIASLKYPEPIVRVGISPDDSHLAVGLGDFTLNVKERRLTAKDAPQAEAERSFARGSYRFLARGHRHQADDDDFVVEAKRRLRLREYEKHLQKFEYQFSLDAVLATKNPVIVVSMLQELNARHGLETALRGRDEETLAPTLRFVIRYITNPRYARILLHVASKLLDLYTPVLGQSVTIDELMFRLRSTLQEELQYQQSLMQLQGQLDALMCASTLREA